MEKILECIIDNILAIIALLGSAYLFLRYERKLKKQQKKLNEQQKTINLYSLKAIEEEEIENKKAEFSAEYHGGNQILIKNKGKATATNVDVKIPSEIPVNENPFPSRIAPGDRRTIEFFISDNTKGLYQIEITWDDNYAKNRQDKLDVQL